ncbi:MAG: hypothetical protein LBQ96_09480 [Fusobacteriaceae bacterium]|jgi:di/tricarboxylate transporter|nr:hypothetical protein [Fusobacteriaceae bacterium]
MLFPVLSLVFLAGAIVLGFVRKMNVGIVSLALAPILILTGGLKINLFFSGYPTKLFLTLLGTMLLFALLQENKTLELLSRKIVALVGKNTFLIPIIVYLTSYLLSAAGPGAISVQAVMILFGVSLAVQMNTSPLLLAAMALLGAVGGTTSPIALTGIIIKDLLDVKSIAGNPATVWIGVTLANFVCALVVYIFFKGYKLRSDMVLKLSDTEKFSKKQLLCLAGLITLAVTVVGFNQDVGIMSFMIAGALIILGAVNETAAVKMIPWSVLILICGINVLMTVTTQLGGIKLLSDVLAKMMNSFTAPFIMSMTGGVMSWFSSANGVVLPTLVPAVPGIVENIGGSTGVIVLVTSITAGATVAGISPMSTGGSLTLAAYSQEKKINEKKQQKLFIQLFALSAAQVLIVSLVALLGLYGIL